VNVRNRTLARFAVPASQHQETHGRVRRRSNTTLTEWADVFLRWVVWVSELRHFWCVICFFDLGAWHESKVDFSEIRGPWAGGDPAGVELGVEGMQLACQFQEASGMPYRGLAPDADRAGPRPIPGKGSPDRDGFWLISWRGRRP